MVKKHPYSLIRKDNFIGGYKKGWNLNEKESSIFIENSFVDPLGLEPRMTVPKTGVLPLHHGSIPLFVKRCKNKHPIGIKQEPFKKCFNFLYFLRGNPYF